jgi:hypothetical protein
MNVVAKVYARNFLEHTVAYARDQMENSDYMVAIAIGWVRRFITYLTYVSTGSI